MLLQTEDYALFGFKTPMDVLSSCVYNGGLQKAKYWLNLKVEANSGVQETPEKTLERACYKIGLQGRCVGMMTAASMDSLRRIDHQAGEFLFSTIITSGLDNVCRAGDPADQYNQVKSVPAGTINMISITNAFLSPAVQVEALMMMTEAKVAVLEALNIKSPQSGLMATGTGTDAMAIASNPGGKPLQYVGKHLLAGEMLARSVIEALTASLART